MIKRSTTNKQPAAAVKKIKGTTIHLIKKSISILSEISTPAEKKKMARQITHHLNKIMA